ncbi:MAG: prepilin peptidase [Proteobacteria bacterium]|nr:prepilin peptidase [Pseudomonadota bacterium]
MDFILTEVTTVTLGLTALIGLLVGSFLNVVILRLPVQIHHGWTVQCRTWLSQQDDSEDATETPPSIVFPASHCPSCKHELKPWHNIPVLSYIFLRGACAFCQVRISPRYPSIEMLTSVTTALVAYKLGLGIQGITAILLCWCLIALTFIDYDHQILPDEITLPLLWGGLLLNLFGIFVPIHEAVIGAISGYMSLWLVYQGFRLLTGKEGMGFGDFKLLAAAGAWLGWQVLPLIILLSATTGSIIGISSIVLKRTSRSQPIPFGPFIATGTVIALLWGNEIVTAYLSTL